MLELFGADGNEASLRHVVGTTWHLALLTLLLPCGVVLTGRDLRSLLSRLLLLLGLLCLSLLLSWRVGSLLTRILQLLRKLIGHAGTEGGRLGLRRLCPRSLRHHWTLLVGPAHGWLLLLLLLLTLRTSTWLRLLWLWLRLLRLLLLRGLWQAILTWELRVRLTCWFTWKPWFNCLC